MSLLIKGGRVVTDTEDYTADILCEGETITAIGSQLDSPAHATVIDAGGKLVMPGFIDPHVHIYLPFMGTYAKDDWDSAGRAAIVGGTTSLIEMICPAANEDPWEAYQLWRGKAESLAPCDFTFHMGVTRFDDGAADKFRRIVADGVASFKVFLAYKGALGVSDEELFKTLELAAELGVIVTAHCENETLVAELQQRLLAAGKTGPEFHEPSRPVRVEASGVQHLTTFAELTGASVYAVHTSNRAAVEAALAARGRGVKIWVETVIPYLTLDESYAQRPDFEGAKYVMSPPIRTKAEQEYLWQALAAGDVSTVATDHAPFDFQGQKEMGRGDFTKIPNGIPSVEERVKLLYTHGVVPGRITLNRFVDAASTQAAKLFGLYPQKGAIKVGSDADLVVWDPEHRGTISAETHLMQTDYSGFEGWQVQGRAEVVTVRGKVMAQSGKFVGEPGHGRFLARKPTH
ncbi:D-hydantoinase [Posidoniimonas polymericola]|uniref:D-hydantoinase n=1 Tax=Posidoniimonas polymericola TaxID=2528002 RepID=A0A5C5YSK9_9BACT|nr:dihydropyrimidinase [Posidoniimonas polymericola]TWT77898.1 D-hydantoinase [Posidoniimonas polymericola]